jgi:hypothetical protein
VQERLLEDLLELDIAYNPLPALQVLSMLLEEIQE